MTKLPKTWQNLTCGSTSLLSNKKKSLSVLYIQYHTGLYNVYGVFVSQQLSQTFPNLMETTKTFIE